MVIIYSLSKCVDRLTNIRRVYVLLSSFVRLSCFRCDGVAQCPSGENFAGGEEDEGDFCEGSGEGVGGSEEFEGSEELEGLGGSGEGSEELEGSGGSGQGPDKESEGSS